MSEVPDTPVALDSPVTALVVFDVPGAPLALFVQLGKVQSYKGPHLSCENFQGLAETNLYL